MKRPHRKYRIGMYGWVDHMGFQWIDLYLMRHRTALYSTSFCLDSDEAHNRSRFAIVWGFLRRAYLRKNLRCTSTVMKKHGKDVTVAPHGDGRWSVTRQGNSRASSVHDRKTDAVKVGRKYAKQEASELILKGLDGQIKSKDSHGHDPKKSKG